MHPPAPCVIFSYRAVPYEFRTRSYGLGKSKCPSVSVPSQEMRFPFAVFEKNIMNDGGVHIMYNPYMSHSPYF